MVVLCCILVVTGFLPSPISRSSLSSPPSQVFSFFYHFLQVKSQFCSRSSLNAGKTEEAREKNIEKLEELGANQSTKLEIASKMMENVKKMKIQMKKKRK